MIVSPDPLVEISVAVDGEAAEAICELFERHGGGAVVELRVAAGAGDDAGDRPASPVAGEDAAGASDTLDTSGDRGIAGVTETWVRTYLPVDDVEARRQVEVGLWYLGRIYPVPEPLVRELAEANWAEAWKAHFAPLTIGRRCWVVPAWIDPAALDLPAEAAVIRLDPGMAFGTGLHPTTQLCLEALEGAVRPGAAVLDVGTGSGILAIGAARLGARRVVGVDIDPKAVEIAAENAALNDVVVDLRAGSIETVEADADVIAAVEPGTRSTQAIEPATSGPTAPGPGVDDPPRSRLPGFDVVVANILAATIIELAGSLAARVRPGGVLIASGILAEQAEAVGAALAAAGLDLAHTAAQGDWVALTARRPGA